MGLDNSVKKLGDGNTFKLDSGEYIFKLDSCADNPVIKPQDLGLTCKEDGKLQIGAVFNGGAEIFQDKVIVMPRCHTDYSKEKYYNKETEQEKYRIDNYASEVWPVISEDGIHFKRFNNVSIKGDGSTHQDFKYGIEDIRIVKYEDMYLLVGCGKLKPPFKGGDSDRIAIYSTKDFINITYHGIVEAFDSRNAVPFSFSLNGKLYILLRFYPNIHLAILDAGIEQLLNPSKHANCWKKIYDDHKDSLLLETGKYPHEKEKMGPSTQIIKTDRGLLILYHAVGELREDIYKAYGMTERAKRGYSICAAILDSNNPKKVLCRTSNPIYIPTLPYELNGNEQYPVDVPAVVFPVGAIVRNEKLLVYCGAGDKYIILLSCNLNSLVDYLWTYCKL